MIYLLRFSLGGVRLQVEGLGYQREVAPKANRGGFPAPIPVFPRTCRPTTPGNGGCGGQP
jgi:hypothetical protein